MCFKLQNYLSHVSVWPMVGCIMSLTLWECEGGCGHLARMLGKGGSRWLESYVLLIRRSMMDQLEAGAV